MQSNRSLTRWLHYAVHGERGPRASRRRPRRGPARNWQYRRWIGSLPSRHVRDWWLLKLTAETAPLLAQGSRTPIPALDGADALGRMARERGVSGQMMTKLQPGQSITRETAELERARPLVVRLHAKYLEIWPKGTQQGYTISYDVIFDAAWKRAAWSAGVEHLPRRRKGRS